MVKRKRLLSNADKDDNDNVEDSRNDLSMESCEALTNGVTLPGCPSLSPSSSVTSTVSDSTVSLAGNRARSRSYSMVDAAALTSVGQDVDSETSTAALQAVLHHITTRSATGRLAKRPKRDPSPPLSPPRKLVKDSLPPISVETTPHQVHHRKQWSVKLKNLFFEGLFEHGKDFDAIQNLIVQKHKRLGDKNTPMKTKDQIRHFYYRTWHKMSGYIDRSGIEDANKQALELFGLICYHELRRKAGAKLDDKKGQRLNELIYKGSTTVKIRGKNCRLKIPTCRALKKLINVDEMKEREESRLKLPERITVELRPRTKCAWARVQSMSKNPRLLLRLPAEKHLSFIIDLLTQKWQSDKDEISSSVEPSGKSHELTLSVPSGCTLSPVSFRPIQAQSKVDLSFTKYLAHFKNHCASAGTTNSPQNKRSAAKLLALAKADDIASSTKLKSAETRQAVVDLKQVLNSSAAALNGCETVEELETLCENSDKLPDNVGSSHPFQLTENAAACLLKADVADILRLEDCPAVGDIRLPEHHVSINCVSNPPSDFSVEKINRLKQPLDKTAAQMYTVAELYLLMSRPDRVPLEYEWNVPSSTDDGSTSDSLLKQISKRLRQLVDVAASEFALTKSQINIGENGTQSATLSGGLLRMADFTRSPRGRNENVAGGKQISRSPLAVGKLKREGMTFNNVAEANLDQSANYSWPSAQGDGSSVAADLPLGNASVADVSALTSLGVGSVSGVIPMGGESVIFRVPTSFPPRVNAGKAGAAILPSTFSERKIVDQNLLEQQHADLLMPKGRSRKLSRNVRKPLVQRTLLPKSQTSASQIVAVAMVPGDASSLGSSTPAFLTSLSSSARCLPPVSVSDASRPSVITMAPTEIRVRRIVPTPVAVPCNSSPGFGPEIVVMCSSVLTRGSTTQQSLIAGSMSTQGGGVLSGRASQIPNAITGVDAFLQEPLHAGTRMSDSAMSSSFLCDSNSMLDISLPIPEASEMSDKLLDMALANSNSSFPGLLDLNSSSSNCRDKESSGSGNSNSFTNNDKNFRGAISHIQQQEESWLSADVAMDLSLSGYINESPMKKFLADATAIGSHSLASRVPASRICSLAAYSAGICGENSRDSVDTSLQCMMNENSYDLASKFVELVRERQEADNAASLLATSNMSHSTSYS